MHLHYCELCKSPVASHEGGMEQCPVPDEKHYCAMHHPDPAYHQDWRPYATHPVVRAVEDKRFTIEQVAQEYAKKG